MLEGVCDHLGCMEIRQIRLYPYAFNAVIQVQIVRSAARDDPDLVSLLGDTSDEGISKSFACAKYEIVSHFKFSFF
ncbi:hypothetical protein D3C76_1755690 [compost metagenome]